MSRIPNPYFAGPPATEPDTFFGRQDVLHFVDDTLASPMHNAIVFYGQRRIGKTSILHQIARRSGGDYQAIFFDLQSSVASPAHDLLYGLAREVASQLNLPAPDRGDFQHDPDAFRTTFLHHVYDHLGDRRLLLLLDEFDALSPETAPAELDALPFVKTLNRLIQSDDKRVVFLFVVGRRLKDLSSQQLQIFRGALDRQITLLRREAIMELITRPAQGILTYQDATTERVWSLTSGHPYFTQLICHKIFNQAQNQDVWTVTEAHVDAVLDDAISAGQSALQWFWDEVPPVERFTLYTIGQLTAGGESATLDQLITQRDVQRVQVPDIELRTLPDKLVDRQVLRRVSEGCYRFAVEVVRRWTVRCHSLEEVTTELTRVAVDESAKDFFRAGKAAYHSDDIDFAIDSFSRALSINPDYVEARLWLARTRAKTGDLLAAIDEFAYVERFGGPEAREARLGLADVRAKYGQQLEEAGKIEEATQEYRRVLELDKQHRLANARLSEIFQQQADEHLDHEGLAAAQPFYEKAVQHSVDVELERRIKEHLEQYSQDQEAIHNWEEAGRARRLSATLMSGAGDEQEALLRFHLRQGRWHLNQHELEAAAGVYQGVMEETADDAPRQIIENDILRYSQQQEEGNNWGRAETALTFLVELFPDDLKNRSRLADSLCRQGEFYLDQNDLAKAKAAYQRALATDPQNQAVANLIRDGFQAYRRARREDSTVPGRELIEEAMLVLVEILGQGDVEAYQWLSAARADLGDALYQEGKLVEAQAVYLQALDDATHLLQIATETDQVYRQRPLIWLKLGQIDLENGEFGEAVERFKQALADATPDQEMADRIKTTFNSYRQRQEETLHWDHARRAIEVLGQLFPDDEEVRFWLAETHAALANWHLQRAIPDLDEAWRLARRALDVSLSYRKADLIITRIKDSFRTRCQQQEEATPPDWMQAEQIMNRLVSLLPGDPAVHRWLAETRVRQGDWYLAQESQSPIEAQHYLTKAAEVYERALSDLPNDAGLVTHLKRSFRAYQDRQEQLDPPARSLAKQAVQTLAELLPHDKEVQQWLAEAEEAAVPPRPWERMGQRWAVIAAAVVAVLCLGGLFFWPGGVDNLIAFLKTDTPTATVTPSATPPPTTPPPTTPPPTTPPPTTPPPTTPPPTISPSPTTPPPTTLPPTTPPPTTPPPTTPPPTTPPPSTTSHPTTPPPTTPPLPTPYPAPQLIGPNHGAVFRGASPLPRLEWEPIGELGPDHYYLVKLEFLRNGKSYPYSMRLKDTAWEVPPEVFHLADPPRRIQWQVVVAQDDDVEASPPSETRAFTWQPDRLPVGEGLDVVVNPKSSLQILVVLREGGIYKSDNGGIDWQQVSNEPSIETLHIAPAKTDIIYAGAYGQILRSEDGGETWEALDIWIGTQPHAAQVHAVATDPDKANILFAATDLGILRSGDGGETWLSLDHADGTDGEVLNKPFYSIVATKSSQGNRVYVAGEGDQIYWRGTDDTGSPWRTHICNACARAIFALAIDPGDGDRLLAGSDEGALGISSNAGYDWNLATIPHSISTLKFSVLAIEPTDPQVVYAGSGSHRHPTDGEGLYRSQDGGLTWQPFNAWASGEGVETYIQGIALTPTDSQVILIAGSEGVFRSDDRGGSWEKQ